MAEQWSLVQGYAPDQRIAEVPDTGLRTLATSLSEWRLTPSGTEGFRKAEITRGGVATDELSQTTLEARKAPGLHFSGDLNLNLGLPLLQTFFQQLFVPLFGSFLLVLALDFWLLIFDFEYRPLLPPRQPLGRPLPVRIVV